MKVKIVLHNGTEYCFYSVSKFDDSKDFIGLMKNNNDGTVSIVAVNKINIESYEVSADSLEEILGGVVNG